VHDWTLAEIGMAMAGGRDDSQITGADAMRVGVSEIDHAA